jgi:hypothetical protein
MIGSWLEEPIYGSTGVGYVGVWETYNSGNDLLASAVETRRVTSRHVMNGLMGSGMMIARSQIVPPSSAAIWRRSILYPDQS